MKTILLIRHAKSSWDTLTVKDEERPLNDRGKKNAPEMARRLHKRKVPIDAFISSPAVRALTTARYFADEYSVSHNKIIVVPSLYMADNSAFIEAIRNAPAEASSVALFSHNNGITVFANSLSDARIDNMPTCGIFAVQCQINDWKKFKPGEAAFYFFDYPKSV
jgi:phosphohistidine phosphatase